LKSQLFESETAQLFIAAILLKPPKIKKVDQASVFALQFAMQPLKHVNEVTRFILKQRWHSRLRYDYAGRSLIFRVAAEG
jgi:hypothetical protein